MKKNTSPQNKKGFILATAMAYMAVAVVLCSAVTAYIYIMAMVASNYTSINENKLIADKIAEDYMECVQDYNNKITDFETSYAKYITEEYYGNNNIYYCYTTLVDIEITVTTNTSTTYKYTKYEYGNI